MTHDTSLMATRHKSGHSEPLLVGRVELARLLGVSAATLDRLRSAGRIGPSALQLSPGRIAWRRTTIERWVVESELAGELLDRKKWQAMFRADASPGRSTAV